MKTIYIPEGAIVPHGAFRNCTNFTHFELPDSLQSIPAYAFAGCTGLEKIWIPEGIEPQYDEEGNQTSFVPIASTAFNDVSTSKMTIHGVSGSYAETFAAEKGYPFLAEAFEYTPATLSGTVVDQTGVGMAGVTVTVYKGPTTNYPFGTTTTGSDGSWTMENVKVGSYYGVGFSMDGYQFSPALTGFTVADGGNTIPTAIGAPEGERTSVLTLSVGTWNCGAASSMRAISVDSDAAWEIASQPDWLTVYTGEEAEAQPMLMTALARDIGAAATSEEIKNSFLLVTKDNDEKNARTGEVAVSNGTTVKTIKVRQSGRSTTFADGGSYTILSPVDGAEYTKIGIPLIIESSTAASARVEYYLEGEKIGDSTYSLPYSLGFSALYNGNYRINVTFYDASGNALKDTDGNIVNPSVEFTLKQSEDLFYGKTQQLTFGVAGGTQSVEFKDNIAEMTLTGVPDWLSTEYSGYGALEVTAAANDTGMKREGTFVVETTFGSKTIVVTQNASDSDMLHLQLSAMPEKGLIGRKLVSEATASGGAGDYLYTFEVHRYYHENGVWNDDVMDTVSQSSNVLIHEVTDAGAYYVICTVSDKGNRVQAVSARTQYDGQVLELVTPSGDGMIYSMNSLLILKWKANPDAVKYGVKIRNLTTNELLPSFGTNVDFFDCGTSTALNLAEHASEFADNSSYSAWIVGFDEDGTNVVSVPVKFSVGTEQTIKITSPAAGSTLTGSDLTITWDISGVTADYYDLYVYNPTDIEYTKNNAKHLPATTTEFTVPTNNVTGNSECTIVLMAFANNVCVAKDAVAIDVQAEEEGFSPIWPLDNHYQINTLNYYEKLNDGGEHECTTMNDTNFYAAGIDIEVPENTAVKAVEDGTIVKIGTSFGLFIKIDHGDGYYSTYGHLNRVCVKNDGSQWIHDPATDGGTAYPVAQDYTMSIPVKKGDVIAYSGNTGGSTGAHLHLDVYQLVGGKWNKFSAWEKYYRSKYRTKLSYASSVYNANDNKKEGDPLSQSVVDWLDQYYEKNTSGIYEYKEKADLPRVYSASVSCADDKGMAWVSDYSFVVETSSNAQYVGMFIENGEKAKEWSIDHSNVTISKNPNNGNLIWTIKYGEFTRAGTRNLSFAAGFDNSNWSERVATGEFTIKPETPAIVGENVIVSPETGTINDQLTISFVTTADIPKVEIWARLVDEGVEDDYFPSYVLEPKRDATKKSGVSVPGYADDTVTASIPGVEDKPNYQYWAWNVKIDPMHEEFPTNLNEYTIKYKVVLYDSDGNQGKPVLSKNAAVLSMHQTTFTYAEGVDKLDATREAALYEVMKKREGETAVYSTQIYMIEGYGSDLDVNGRGSAMCVVVKDGMIVFTNTSCATLPDQPFHAQSNPTLTNKNNKADWDDQPNVVDGVYPVGNVKHGNPAYPALEVKNNVVYRIHSKTCGGGTNGEIHSSKCGTTTSGGIHIHKNFSEKCEEVFYINDSGNNVGSVNSAGCTLIDKNAWNSFASAVGFAGDTDISNTCVVYDRLYAYENVPSFKTYMQEKYTDTEGYAYSPGYYDEAAVKAICGIQSGSGNQDSGSQAGYPRTGYLVRTQATTYPNPNTQVQRGYADGKTVQVDGEEGDFYKITFALDAGGTATRYVLKEDISFTEPEQPINPFLSDEEFMDLIGKMAQYRMEEDRILASVTIAQAILESSWGKSKLSMQANALFGVKAGNVPTGHCYYTKTEEEKNGQIVTIYCYFRAFDSLYESFEDHADVLKGERYTAIIGETDYRVCCQVLEEKEYATSSAYAESLIEMIETNNLTKYDHASWYDGIIPEVDVKDYSWREGYIDMK